jgi:integrase
LEVLGSRVGDVAGTEEGSVRGDGWIERHGKGYRACCYAPGADGKKNKWRQVAATEKAARLLLRDMLNQVANDEKGIEPLTPAATKRVLMNELFDEHEKDFLLHDRKNLRTLRGHQKRPREAFGHLPAITVTTKRIETYVLQRKEDGAKPATIDRETETVSRAIALANKHGMRIVGPDIPKLLKKNANAKQTLLSRAESEAILAGIESDDFRDLLDWFRWTGMRPKEICSLTWANEHDGEIRLTAKDAKIGEGRIIPIVGPLVDTIARRRSKRGISPFIFQNRHGRTLAGTTGGFKRWAYVQWRRAAAAIGRSDATPYDLRRSAMRNMLKGGASLKDAMAITGHKTVDTAMRYQIIDAQDRVDTLTGAFAFVETQPKKLEQKVVPFQRATSATGEQAGKIGLENGPKTGPKWPAKVGKTRK